MKKILYILLIFAFISSCDVFSTRDPEDPESGRLDYSPATDPEILISNLKRSIEEKSSENYINTLADSLKSDLPNFEFIPSADVRSAYSGIFIDWNIDKEDIFINSLFSGLVTESTISFDLEGNFENFASTDSLEYNAEYKVYLTHTNELVPDSLMGAMQLILKKNESNIWKISKWTDWKKSDSEDKTWSILKAIL